jgi:hypothetical protein
MDGATTRGPRRKNTASAADIIMLRNPDTRKLGSEFLSTASSYTVEANQLVHEKSQNLIALLHCCFCFAGVRDPAVACAARRSMSFDLIFRMKQLSQYSLGQKEKKMKKGRKQVLR